MLPKTAKDTRDSQSRLDFFLMLVSELDQVDKDSVVKPKSEVLNLQTFRMESRKEKSMVLPGTRDMPKFLSSRPTDLRKFIRQLKDLWKEASITEDSEKKESIGKYADQDSGVHLKHMVLGILGKLLKRNFQVIIQKGLQLKGEHLQGSDKLFKKRTV